MEWWNDEVKLVEKEKRCMDGTWRGMDRDDWQKACIVAFYKGKGDRSVFKLQQYNFVK